MLSSVRSLSPTLDREFSRGSSFGALLGATRRLENWRTLGRFCVVGSLGYLVNLAVYAAVLQTNADFRLAAVCSFLVAVSHNYILNRRWTFAALRGHFGRQGARFFTVSVTALGLNVLLLTTFASMGMEHLPAQAAAIILVTPVSFVGNRLWSFGPP